MAGTFGAVMCDLGRAAALPAMPISNEEIRAELEEVLLPIGQALEVLPVSHVVKGQFEDLRDTVLDPQCKESEMVVLFRVFQQSLLRDLGSGYFLTIPRDDLKLYFDPVAAFGQVVADKFHGTEFDIAGATRCYVLEEWTACVFHLMRIAEKGLHWLAQHLGIPMSAEIEVQQWGAIIGEIRKHIEAIKNERRTTARAERMAVYSELATHLTAIQGAWRDHVMHSRGQYGKRDADVAWNSTKALMLRLADIAP